MKKSHFIRNSLQAKTYSLLASLLIIILVGCKVIGNGGDDSETVDYSGTYYVNLASQPRWQMTIVHSGQDVTFTLDGMYSVDGEGTADNRDMSLTCELDGTLNIFITFSEDGQDFSGTWEHTTSSGTITGSKSPWSTYDVDSNGIPEFVSTDVIELQKISQISKFRSGAGHDYSDDFESCRSMKHYFIPDVERTSVKIFSPIDGTVIGTTDEWSEESVPKGTMVSIESEDFPAFHIIIFHIDLTTPLDVGDDINAGQLLGYPPDYDAVTIADTAVGVITPNGYKLVSYFEVMTDTLLQSYQDRGVGDRDDLIISETQRDAYPLTCEGETFVDNGTLENWFTLN